MTLARRFLMVHHSLTADGQTVSWGAIERYHRDTNGWADIGYHFGVELIGSTYYAMVGRAEHRPAAACPQGNMNSEAIHVCLVGNFDLIEPPENQLLVAAHRIILPVMDRYGIVPARIVGHRDYNPAKSCPGAKFNLDRLRKILTGGAT